MTAAIHINSQGECLLGPHVLHPAQDPAQAARDDLQELLPDVPKGGRLLVVGAGLGWHAKVAAQAGWRVAVLEPDPVKRAVMAALGPPLQEALVLDNINQLHELLGKDQVYADGGVIEVFAPPAVSQTEAELESAARAAVDQAISRAQVDRATRLRKAEMWLDNLTANFKHVVQLPDPTHLVDRFAGTPALIIGAGPSLDHSLAGLRGWEDQALVLCAASALGPLARAGITPHAALALEGKDESRQFRGADPSQTVLLAASTGHARHFSSWSGTMGIFHLFPWIATLAQAPAALPNGGHATSAAFALAVLWGCDPVILVGQDLAYTEGKIHASGRPGGEDEARPDARETDAIGGGRTNTSEVMQSYINWYQEAAAYLQKREQKVRVINATHAGAMLHGFEHMPLDEARALLPEAGVYPGRLRNSLVSQVMPRPNQAAQACMAARVELRKTLHLLEEKGAEAAKASLPQGSPGAWVTEGWTPGQGPEGLRSRIERLSAALLTMAEGVHG